MKIANNKSFIHISSVLSLVVGLGAAASLVMVLFNNIHLLRYPEYLWHLVIWWPKSLFVLITHLTVIKQLNLFFFIHVFITVTAPVLGFVLAKSMNKSHIGWCIASFIFPYVLVTLSLKGLRRNKIYSQLDKKNELDLMILHQQGFVRAHATGQSITQIHGEVENLIDKTLRVIISRGTYFVARGNYQNMVTRSEYAFTLDPLSVHKVAINAVCINAGLPIPGEQDRFSGVRKVSADVSRFLDAAQNSNPMVVQAGVWALTDNYSASDIKSHLISRDQYGNRRPAVTDPDIAEAKLILDGLVITHRL